MKLPLPFDRAARAAEALAALISNKSGGAAPHTLLWFDEGENRSYEGRKNRGHASIMRHVAVLTVVGVGIAATLCSPRANRAIVATVCWEKSMSNIYLERKKNKPYVASQNGRTIATGNTQEQAGSRAHTKRPEDPILAERQRKTKVGGRDKWRRFYP